MSLSTFRIRHPSKSALSSISSRNPRQTSLAKQRFAGLKHWVALSVVGIDRLPTNSYFRAKLAQEEIIKASGVPFTIVRATQFLEFLDAIAYTSTQGDVVTVSTAYLQPIAAEDVAKFVAEAALSEPQNKTTDVAGPEAFRTTDIMTSYLKAKGDKKKCVGDPQASYFGSKLDSISLVPVGTEAKLGSITYEAWLATQATTS
jgi:uncharacterized protein YbjT (DUF2867 family)